MNLEDGERVCIDWIEILGEEILIGVIRVIGAEGQERQHAWLF
jgi:hypothetical protein